MGNKWNYFFRMSLDHSIYFLLASVWLAILVFAIFPNYVAPPIIMMFGDFLGVTQENTTSLSLGALSKLFIEKASYFFIPLAVASDTFIIWMLMQKSEMKSWLPTKILRDRKPIVIVIVVILATISLIVGVFTGLAAKGYVADSTENELLSTTSATLSLLLILFFALVAKYCSLVTSDKTKNGSKTTPIDIGQLLAEQKQEK